ncbi:hypothetical protein [Serratia rubidaea]|uniref:hypothetical protein n=1 Tax=Serratia rubidaea TaxID=61652 RepID=UPI0013965F2C|nr:hypothetical protein [Serratia rubidaea]QPR66053.1 hypothetical protein I6G83_02930 [Serratia rubidaea]HAY0639218.1 hypothetical protein [Serratia rubidaea]
MRLVAPFLVNPLQPGRAFTDSAAAVVPALFPRLPPVCPFLLPPASFNENLTINHAFPVEQWLFCAQCHFNNIAGLICSYNNIFICMAMRPDRAAYNFPGKKYEVSHWYIKHFGYLCFGSFGEQ